MTFSGRIRLYLIAAAVVPSVILMTVIYYHAERQSESAHRRAASEGLAKFETFNNAHISDIATGIVDVTQALERPRFSGGDRELPNPRARGLDFFEIIDNDYNVVATFHRPGLLGEQALPESLRPDTTSHLETVEYDINGPHAAHVFMRRVDNDRLVYSGAYLDEAFVRYAAALTGAEIALHYDGDGDAALERMDRGVLYRHGGAYRAALAGSKRAGFHLTATFPPPPDSPAYVSLLMVAGLLAAVAAAVAIGVGMFITGRAKREIANLVQASDRVAKGDFATPVMAYEEGEFAQLADALTHMMTELKTLQNRLATSEKIAAWQTIGRKVAHEIKNPLTPIAISADDLRRSYHEKLPGFDETLNDTTRTIKVEVERLRRLLDEFVGFARMAPPEIRAASVKDLLAEVAELYAREAGASRVSIRNECHDDKHSLDPDAIKQVLVNLVKNGLESAEDATATVTARDSGGNLEFEIADSGPGFTDEKLANSFEPYATTKEHGSGLGLVICHRIIHDHGGVMALSNSDEGGAAVRIELPAN